MYETLAGAAIVGLATYYVVATLVEMARDRLWRPTWPSPEDKAVFPFMSNRYLAPPGESSLVCGGGRDSALRLHDVPTGDSGKGEPAGATSIRQPGDHHCLLARPVPKAAGYPFSMGNPSPSRAVLMGF